MALWVPGPWDDDRKVDWEVYRNQHQPESPHQAAIDEPPARKRTPRENRTDG
jgi:hypothetical protein